MSELETSAFIRTRNQPTCYICGTIGQSLYRDLTDKVFDTSGNWGMLYCSQCKLAWLNPHPAPEDIHKIYNDYYTHKADRVRGLLSQQNPIRANILANYYGYKELEKDLKPGLSYKILSLHPFFKEIVGLSIMHLAVDQRGRLLDVGCGSGQYLSIMKSLGWDVKGTEVDQNAAAIARNEYGLDVFVGNLEDAHFPSESFNIITLIHVIEHLYDPIHLLIECRRILKPGGKLILTTPNIESLGHALFKGDWRGLEIPRHLMVFSLNSIELCTRKAGFKTTVLRGSARISLDVYLESKLIRNNRKASDIPKLSYKIYRAKGWLFQFLVESARTRFREIPDEIYYVGE